MTDTKELLDDELQEVAGGLQQFDEGEVAPYPVGAKYKHRCTSSRDDYYVQIVKCDYVALRRTYMYIVNTWYINRIYNEKHDSKQINIFHGALDGYEKVE